MNWKELKGIRPWAPLGQVAYAYKRLDERLVQLREDAYLTTVSADRQGEKEGASYVTIVMWAKSEGAARRSLLHEVEADLGEKNRLATS
jgi:hypothetical protein